MNLVEIDRALRQLRLSGMAAVLETRLRHAQTEKLASIDFVSMLVSDELLRRQDRLWEQLPENSKSVTIRVHKLLPREELQHGRNSVVLGLIQAGSPKETIQRTTVSDIEKGTH